MNDLTQKQLLLLRSKVKKPFELRVDGISMLPILHPGDSIKVCAKDEYTVGDILVFFYKDDSLLVHRLLKVENGRYFCKGDNAFRLEDIEKQNIVGAVMLDHDANNTPDFITASYSMSRIFRKMGYNSDKMKSSAEYAEYAQNYLGENR